MGSAQRSLLSFSGPDNHQPLVQLPPGSNEDNPFHHLSKVENIEQDSLKTWLLVLDVLDILFLIGEDQGTTRNLKEMQEVTASVSWISNISADAARSAVLPELGNLSF